MRTTQKLRRLLAERRLVVAPGSYDGLTARLIEQAGFDLVYMGGAVTSATHGLPDYGLTTMTEIVANASRIAGAIDVPLICDADTGYGNELNVTRAVQEFERHGIAGIHIEDQVFPKRCGHLAGKQVVPREEFVSKIRAAAAARRDPDFLLIARSDALAPNGFEDAVARVNAALEAGADMAFIDAPQTLEQVASIPKLVKGPCLLNIVSGGKTPDVDLKMAQEMGYRMAILSSLMIFAALQAFDSALQSVKATGRTPAGASTPELRELFRRLGSDQWDEVRERFARGGSE
jgi:2-methylisocitrate lyase-like PEP mutase family enzyme